MASDVLCRRRECVSFAPVQEEVQNILNFEKVDIRKEMQAIRCLCGDSGVPNIDDIDRRVQQSQQAEHVVVERQTSTRRLMRILDVERMVLPSKRLPEHDDATTSTNALARQSLPQRANVIAQRRRRIHVKVQSAADDDGNRSSTVVAVCGGLIAHLADPCIVCVWRRCPAVRDKLEAHASQSIAQTDQSTVVDLEAITQRTTTVQMLAKLSVATTLINYFRRRLAKQQAAIFVIATQQCTKRLRFVSLNRIANKPQSSILLL